MSYDTRTSLALAAAVALMLSGWGAVTTDVSALLAAFVGAAVVLGIGVAARWLRLGEPTVVSMQGLGALGAGAAAIVGPAGLDGLGELPHVGSIVADGLGLLRTGTPPLAPAQAVAVALVGVTAVVALLLDVLAVSLQRPGLVVLPLLGLFLVPALGSGGTVSFAQAVRFGVALVVVLFVAAPQPVGRRAVVPARTSGLVVTAAVTAAALGLAWLLAPAVPLAPAGAVSNVPIQMTDPSLDLRRNLTTTAPVPVLSYTTDAPGGTSLKLATLTAFDASGFKLDTVRVFTGGRLPAAPGLTHPGATRRTQIQVAGFESEWLPVPWAPRDVAAPGRWGYAGDTFDVMAMGSERRTATRGIAYEVTSTEVRPSEAEIGAAQVTAGSAALPPELSRLTKVPDSLPPRVRTLAHQVTDAAPTAGAKALALQSFLRSDRFRYTTTRAPGDTMSTLEDFLFVSRAGYCEQFAGSMVAMARALGIPARMAIGFTPGTLVEGRWQVTSHDMHTWPELWLDGWGWVAFEPTPSGTAAVAPLPQTSAPTASAPASAATEPPPTAEPDPEDQPSAAASETPTSTPSASSPAAPSPPPTGESAPSGLPTTALLIVAALAGLAGLASLPRLLRARRRTVRLAGGADARASALAAWDEVRDTAADLGVSWPSGSPRYAAETLAAGLPADAARGVRELASATERALFDDPSHVEGPVAWATTVRTVTDALGEQASRGEALRAQWWPRSLWRRD